MKYMHMHGRIIKKLSTSIKGVMSVAINCKKLLSGNPKTGLMSLNVNRSTYLYYIHVVQLKQLKQNIHRKVHGNTIRKRDCIHHIVYK